MRIQNRFTVIFGRHGIMAIVLLLGSSLVIAQPPDESQLPAAKPPPVVPSEGQLPSTTPAPPTAIPSEAALPGVVAGVPDTERESSLSPGSLRPWLRLRFDGHTGTIRALAMSADGQHLVSAGEDKDLHIWARQVVDGVPQHWFHRRTIRWQVERGPRGRIYAIAVQGDLVAMAGHGATGGLGEIWIVDLTSGNLVRSLVDVDRGHRQVIASLAWQPVAPGAASGAAKPAEPPAKAAEPPAKAAETFAKPDEVSPAGETEPAASPEGNATPLSLASADVEGRVILWTPDASTGIWNPRTIIAPDPQTYGAALAPALASRRRFLPITFLGHDQLLMPRYVGATPNGEARWHLQRFYLSTTRSDLVAADHIEMMTCMAASDDGKRLATGDAMGRVWLYSFENPQQPVMNSIERSRLPLSMDFSPDAKRLLVGTAAAVSPANSRSDAMLEWLDTSVPGAAPNSLSQSRPAHHVWGSVYDLQLGEAISVSANSIQTHTIAGDQLGAVPSQILTPKVASVRRVAFTNDNSAYKIALGTKAADDGTVPLEHAFDLSAVRLDPTVDPTAGGIDPATLIDPLKAQGNWQLKLERDDSGERHFLFEGETRRGRLPLRGELHGLVTSAAWFSSVAQPDGANVASRAAVAVGTDGRNNIYVYERGPAAEAKLLRQYRGHTGTVLSVGVSADLRYLVSGSDDATVSVWKLEDLFTADELTNRWGATFEVQGERLFALDVRRDGPLYFRGVRAGDQLVNIGWIDNGQAKAVSEANAMLAELSRTDFDALVMFQFARLGRPREGFQSFPAWQPVATLFVDQSREWAFWTPAGFYDASFGGNELFGWQINRGVAALPEYFRAAQFRQRLEKPAAMRRLMSAGDLTTAMEEGVSGIAPPPGEAAIVNQFLNKPTIRLLRPTHDQSVTENEVEVLAEILVPRGAVLELPKAFAGGVPATGRQLVSHENAGDKERYVYRWIARLPGDTRVPLELVAATDAGATDRVSIELDNQSHPSPRKPRLHFLALGISQYADPQIQSLDFAARGAGVMADLFREETGDLYRTTTSQLLDRDAIRPLWRDYAAQAARELAADIGPDDLVVMYLCGHGLRDRRTNQWYFVTADARYNDLMNDRYDDLLSFDDLAMLGELPCRKLAIIDSCHSGAVQPVMRNDDLKAALRLLQGDIVLTITASEGEEEAAEQKDRQLGRFTSHLLDALRGHADLDQDGVVTLREAVDHVVKASAEESRTSGFVQHPTAGPADLLKTLQLPLTRP